MLSIFIRLLKCLLYFIILILAITLIIFFFLLIAFKGLNNWIIGKDFTKLAKMLSILLINLRKILQNIRIYYKKLF
jgi:hypothetical protein